MVIKLYLPEKYKVVVGKGKHFALCTGWSVPDDLTKRYPELLQKFSIIGPLHGKEGISILVRDLCLNPQIRYLVLWAHHPLSKTPFGSSGISILKAIWEKGVGKDNLVKSTSFKLHAEIGKESMDKMISNVKLLDLSDIDMGSLLKEISSKKYDLKEPYMKPSSFPETKRDTSKQLPSEEVGFCVRGKNVSEAWTRAVDKILRYGSVKETQYGNRQKELQVITWVIENEDIENPYVPKWKDETLKAAGFEKESIEEYKKAFLDPKVPRGASYTYGSRLNSYLGKTDQIEAMIKKIKDNPVTRRAVAFTFYPPEDLDHDSPPCLSMIQAVVNNEMKLNMFAVFRSHDIFKAAIPNAFGLLGLQKHIAERTGYVLGKLSITSTSAHIYEEDWQHSEDLISSYRSSIKMHFDERSDTDPRGNMIISLSKGKINVTLVSGGEELMEIDGTSAREVAMKVSRLDLLSRPDHYIYLALELAKAEYALKNRSEYVQDSDI